MPTHKQRQGFRHPLLVERPPHYPRPPTPERLRRGRNPDIVAVSPVYRPAPRIKSRRRLPHSLYGHAGRECMVQSAQPALQRQSAGGAQCGDLPHCVDPSVRAPCQCHTVRAAGQRLHGLFQRALHGCLGRLPLGTSKGGAVILNPEGDPPMCRIHVRLTLHLALRRRGRGLRDGPIHQFQLRHAGAIAQARPEFGDPGVATLAVRKPRRQIIKQMPQHFAVG